jgi:hypothetical protein
MRRRSLLMRAAVGAEVVEDDERDEARDEAVAGLLYRISMLATDNMPQDHAEE